MLKNDNTSKKRKETWKMEYIKKGTVNVWRERGKIGFSFMFSLLPVEFEPCLFHK